MVRSLKQRSFMAVKRRNKSVYISVYSYTIPAFWLKNPVFPGVFVSIILYLHTDSLLYLFYWVFYCVDAPDAGSFPALFPTAYFRLALCVHLIYGRAHSIYGVSRHTIRKACITSGKGYSVVKIPRRERFPLRPYTYKQRISSFFLQHN